METETIFISDESDPEDSPSTRRKADEQDPLEGKRILRKKKPKVSFHVLFWYKSLKIVKCIWFQIENDQKKDPAPTNSEKKEDESPEVKKSDIDPPDYPRYDILTTLEGASFQSRLPYDKMTT